MEHFQSLSALYTSCYILNAPFRFIAPVASNLILQIELWNIADMLI